MYIIHGTNPLYGNRKERKIEVMKIPQGVIFDPSFPQPPSHAWKT